MSLALAMPACGPRLEARECEEGFLETARIEASSDLTELERVNHIRRLEIVGSDLETLEGLECVEWVETLRIEDNAALRDLTGLEQLVEVRPEPCDEAWATPDCFPYLEFEADGSNPPAGIGDVTIRGNASLASLTGLDALEYVTGALVIEANASLSSVTGLESLERVGFVRTFGGGPPDRPTGLRIEANSALASMTALASYVGGTRLEVRKNPALTEFLPVRSSGGTEFAGRAPQLILEDLPQLPDLDGLTGWSAWRLHLLDLPLVEAIPPLFVHPDANARFMGWIVLERNSSLRSLGNFGDLRSLCGGIVLRGNHALETLAGLEHLEFAGGHPSAFPSEEDGAFVIEGNASLKNLDALNPAADGVFEGLLSDRTGTIRGNPSLPTCSIEEFLDEITDGPLEESGWVVESNGRDTCE